jgi:hypothetical protein
MLEAARQVIRDEDLFRQVNARVLQMVPAGE